MTQKYEAYCDVTQCWGIRKKGTDVAHQTCPMVTNVAQQRGLSASATFIDLVAALSPAVWEIIFDLDCSDEHMWSCMPHQDAHVCRISGVDTHVAPKRVDDDNDKR